MRRTYTWAMALVATLVLGLMGAVPANAVDTYTVSVKVTTAGGAGISGVSLSLSQSASPYYYDYASTDGTGVATFTDVPGSSTLSLTGTAYVGSTSKQISQTVTVGSANVSTTVALAGTQAITGKVTDKATGAGLANVSVSADAWSGNDYGYGTTAANGTYAVLVAAGAYRVSFSASSGGYLYSYYPNTTDYFSAKKVTVASGKDLGGINAALVKPGKLTGKVTYNGKAVKAANVYAAGAASGGSTTTSSTGVYSVTANPGTYSLSVYRAPTSPFLTTYYGGTVREPDAKKITVTSGKTVTGVNVALKAGATLKGVVKNSAGKVVKGAQVYAENTTRSGYAYATTNSKGAYVLYGLATGKVVVNASASKGTTFGTTTVTAAQGKTKSVKTIVVKAPGSATVKGTFAVKSGKVTEATAVLINSKKLIVDQVTPSKKGAVSFKRLPAGTYTVVFSGTNISKKVTVKAKKTVSFGKLTRPKLTTVKGTVRAPNGKVLANASVSLADSFGTWAGNATTNSKGAYSIKNLAKGKYSVTAYDYNAAYVPVSATFTAKSGKNVTKSLKLKTGGTLKGVVKNSKGKAVAGVNVYASSGGYATTNAKGAYVIKGVKAGKTTVSFFDPYVGGYLNATKKATAKAGKTVTVATVKIK